MAWNRKVTIFLLSLILGFSALGRTFAEIHMSAEVDKEMYAIGESIKVMVHVNQDTVPGFHNLFFDLNYDATILCLENITRGELIVQEKRENDFLYSVSKKLPQSGLGSKVVVSYALRQPVELLAGSGILMELSFRVIDKGAAHTKYSFTFAEYAVEDKTGTTIPSVQWSDSRLFTIGSFTSNVYLSILHPEDNRAIQTDSCTLDAICPANAKWSVLVTNPDTRFRSAPLPAASGVIQVKNIPLVAGFNRLKAELVDEYSRILTTAAVTVYRSPDAEFVKILQPADHALVTTDMVEVKLATSADDNRRVMVNGVPCVALHEQWQNHYLYFARVWLKQGFNTIEAEAERPDGVKFKDSITVYYQKDDLVFRICSPFEGEVFKVNEKTKLSVIGEIGARFDAHNQPNTVDFKLIYHPRNNYLPSRILVPLAPVAITENPDRGANTQAAYTFRLDTALDFTTLDTGTIEIIAYKNKRGDTWESEVHRTILVDNSRLWIDLRQPGIFSRDELDSLQKIREFSGQQSDIESGSAGQPVFTDTEITGEGKILLQSSVQLQVNQENGFEDYSVKKIVERKDGTLFALVNQNKTLSLYKKTPEQTAWDCILTREDLFGYDICDTDEGLLVGVSNLFYNANSGLYLLKEDVKSNNVSYYLINILLGEPINHVQFIINREGTIYLYGDNYSHLYYFKIFSLEGANGRLSASVKGKMALTVNGSITDFVLSQNTGTAVALTANGELLFFQNLNGQQFEPWSRNSEVNKNSVYGFIKYGTYITGDYNAFLCLKKDRRNALVVMEDKENLRLLPNTIDLGDTEKGLGLKPVDALLGIGYVENAFTFFCTDRAQAGFTCKKLQGQIFFDQILLAENTEVCTSPIELTPGPLGVYAAGNGVSWLGIGSDNASGALYAFYHSYANAGTVLFRYLNRDTEGINSFSFEVEPCWIPGVDEKTGTEGPSFLDFGFTLKDYAHTTLYTFPPVSLRKLLNQNTGTNSFFTAKREFNVESHRDVITVQLNELTKDVYLEFSINLKRFGRTTPELTNLTIDKKMITKLPRSGDDIIYLPIHGYVYDPTVMAVSIQGDRTAVEWDRSFSYNYPVKTSVPGTQIRLYCANASGESASLSFQVRVFDSRALLDELEFKDADHQPISPQPLKPCEYYTEKEVIIVSGAYIGLIGALAGYEIYDYVYKDGREEAVLLRQGVFGNEGDSTLQVTTNLSGVSGTISALFDVANATGYAYGTFVNQPIQLIPGKQRLVVYVENPGGYRYEYKRTDPGKGDRHPDFIFDIPETEQEICLTNTLNVENINELTADNIRADKKINLTIFETKTAPYSFIKEYMLYGEIKSLYAFYELKVVSASPDICFDNGKSDMVIAVDESNRFQAKLLLRMPEDKESASYYISFEPTAPLFQFLKKAVRIDATKSYKDTRLIPDFWPMATNDFFHGNQWSDDERKNRDKQIRLAFERFIPEGTVIDLTLNFEEPIRGLLKKESENKTDDAYIYNVVESGSRLSFDKEAGLKYGRNRVQWLLRHRNGDVIASSTSGLTGMSGFLFDLPAWTNLTPTSIEFPVKANVYYPRQEALPLLKITRDTTTTLAVLLNGEAIPVDASQAIKLTDYKLLEGKNVLKITCTENPGNPHNYEYSFLYDTLEPRVNLASYVYNTDYTRITSLTAIVQEMNLSRTTLYFGQTLQEINQAVIIDIEPEVVHIKDDLYSVTWQGLDLYPYLNISPAADAPLLAGASDHAGRVGYSTAFPGIKNLTRPNTETPVIITELERLHYTSQPNLPDFSTINEQAGINPFPEHAKFYNPSLVLKDGLEITGTLLAERQSGIVVGRDTTVTETGALYLHAGDHMLLKPGFFLKKGGILAMTPRDFTVIDPLTRFYHNELADALSIVFWLRNEQEELYAPDTGERRVLTLCDDSERALWLEIKELTISLKYLDKKNTLNNTSWSSFPLSPPGSGTWDLVTLAIDGVNKSISLAIDDEREEKALTDSELFLGLLSKDAEYSFGPALATQSGHFSVADAFYINQLLKDINYVWEFIDLLPRTTAEAIRERGGFAYFFHTPADRIGESKEEYLRVTPEGFYTDKENANLSETAGRGSLRAARLQKNLLKTSGTGHVIFANAENSITSNCIANADALADTLCLKPKDTGYPAKYYFGNTFTNHGLQPDNWYSVSGTITDLDESEPALPAPELIIRLNGREQRFKLGKGPFHCVYRHDGTSPGSLLLSIETRKSLTLKRDMIFNEGDYILPLQAGEDKLAKTFASTQFDFGSASTVEFWYKPYNVNRDGFSHYNTVLLDSNYYTLGTTYDNSKKNYAVYYLRLKSEGAPELPATITNIPVRMGWQHLQVSCNSTPEKTILFFYVNGELAYCYESSLLPVPPPPGAQSDNLYFGTSLDRLSSAQGFIDEIILSHLYKGSVYKERRPVQMDYKDTPAPGLTISLNPVFRDCQITDISYELESRDGHLRKMSQPPVITEHGFNMPGLEPGVYLLRLKARFNGYNFEQAYSFVKMDRPKFFVRYFTPIVIRNQPSKISFCIEHDSSYLLDNQRASYAGLAIRLTYNNGTAKTCYLTQNFLSPSDRNWLWGTDDVPAGWQILATPDNLLNYTFNEISAESPVRWEIRSFYFENSLDLTTYAFDKLNAPTEKMSGTISTARLVVTPVSNANREEFKLHLLVPSDLTEDEIFKRMNVQYTVRYSGSNLIEPINGIVKLNGNNSVYLYYDDLYKNAPYGKYEGDFYLVVDDRSCSKVTIPMQWDRILDTVTVRLDKALSIVDFSLLSLDRKNGKSRLYLEFSQSLMERLAYTITILQQQTSAGSPARVHTINGFINDVSKGFQVFGDVPVFDGLSRIKLELNEIMVTGTNTTETGLKRTSELAVENSGTAPELVLTNTVPSLIGYNNVSFSWRGSHNGLFKAGIEYSYNVDGQGWTTPNSQWRNLDLFNLEDGYHNFKVKALYEGLESPEYNITFLVDINKPVFDETKIEVRIISGEDGIPEAVTIVGREGAIKDPTLDTLKLNGEKIKIGNNGSFAVDKSPLLLDGVNFFNFMALDRTGNFREHKLSVDNRLTEIIYPAPHQKIRYAPVTLAGRIKQDIYANLNIYVLDAAVKLKLDEQGRLKRPIDFSGWKKAQINEDRTFFVEDIAVHPGTINSEAYTPLLIATIFDSGRIFFKEVSLRANETIMPIEISLNTHAAEGESTHTEVEFRCRANVENISSWSIDYNGDGVYDTVDMVDNPALGKEHQWLHTYSSLGLVKPRVRIITASGQYFSATDELIIHEKIKAASNVLVINPISLSAIQRDDGSSRIFVLKGASDDYSIDVYHVGRNDSYLSNRLFTIALKGFGLGDPVTLTLLSEKSFLIATNQPTPGVVYYFEEDQFGNYHPVREATIYTNTAISDLTADSQAVYIGFSTLDQVATVPLQKGTPVPAGLRFRPIQNNYAQPVGQNLHLAADEDGVLVSDYLRARLLRLSPELNIMEYAGEWGNDEGQFIKPGLIHAYQNRIFVYDEARGDVQVFDPDFKMITTLKYHTAAGYENYLDTQFFNRIADLGVLTREENGRLFYYALLLSKSSSRLAMLRLPQWEELRVRVRNNKLVFLKDGEVFTAKPEGSDLARILSSDAIPRIEGVLDFPAYSPDGKRITFTARNRLYDGNTADTKDTVTGSYYDSLYTIDTNGQNLIRIPLNRLITYEIERPVFSFNGDKLIFSARPRQGKWQIYYYTFATGAINQLFSSDENARFPYFSPDDRYVAFTSDYEGDEEIEIFDTQNPSTRVTVTSNGVRDSFPVWSPVFINEIKNTDAKITSKLAFVSERNFHKGIYYIYLKQPADSNLEVTNYPGDTIDYRKLDEAAVELTTPETEGDYPAFTGDGTAVVHEFYDGQKQLLKHYSFESKNSTAINIPSGASRPAGMKNSITGFKAEVMDGNNLRLTWNRYTEQDIFYTVIYTVKGKTEGVAKKVSTQDSALIKGLEMGVTYLVRVIIKENNEEIVTSQIREVIMPTVFALPTYTIDPVNPYLVQLKAWTPDPDKGWRFSWFIDNQELNVQTSTEYRYEFATSGMKTVILKVADEQNKFTHFSLPLTIPIVSDIRPVIEYTLAEDTSYIELDASRSPGSKIDWAQSTWRISGPGRTGAEIFTGSRVILDLQGFKYKLNINLMLRRIQLNGQTATDSLEKNMVIDLDIKEVKPVITYETSKINPLLFHFSGNDSFGNIEWQNARWSVYGEQGELHREDGVSTMDYVFLESASGIPYTVVLTVPRRNDGQTETASILVPLKPEPIKPVIDYKIMTLKEGDNITGAKILFSCGNSKGSNIDFSQARWSVPLADSYNEQANQAGPTAVYNLMGIGSTIIVDVSLTLQRRGGTESVTVTRPITIQTDAVPRTELVVRLNTEQGTGGTVLVFDALASTGPNINWEKTEWLLDGVSMRKGPVARLDLPQSGETTAVNWVCTLYSYGSAPLTRSGKQTIVAGSIKPVITYTKLPGGADNRVYELNVQETEGINIDWERTHWYIFDGHQALVQYDGSAISHTFAPRQAALGYPVMVKMFFKQSNLAFVGYTSIDIEADTLQPVITWEKDLQDPNLIHFSARSSAGSAIDWAKTRWSFGDASEPQFGVEVLHKYPLENKNREYSVCLTITRTLLSGPGETAAVTKLIRVDSDEIRPVIKARLYNDGYLVLSAEESAGRGLLLDRSYWLLEGAGDSESYNINRKVGTVKQNSYSTSKNESAGTSYGNETSQSNFTGTDWGDQTIREQGQSNTVKLDLTIGFGATAYSAGVNLATTGGSKTVSDSESNSIYTSSSRSQTFATATSRGGNTSTAMGEAKSFDETNYEGFIDNTATFSSGTSHTGAMCRHYVGTYNIANAAYGERKFIVVTLMVYRANSQGGLDARSITVNISLDSARQEGGIQYE